MYQLDQSASWFSESTLSKCEGGDLTDASTAKAADEASAAGTFDGKESSEAYVMPISLSLP